MVSQNARFNPPKGLLPLIDPRITKQPFVVDGRSFLMDFKGPRSGWGNTLSTIDAFADASYAQDVDIEGEIYVLTNEGVFRHDNTNKMFYPAFVFAATADEVWPWSVAKVGGSYFFIKKGSGLIQYVVNTGAWSVITPTGLPTAPTSLCVAEGRLIILGTDFVAWSAVDDGTDFTSAGTGAQVLAMIGGTPLGVKPTEEGFLTYSTKGIMRSFATGSITIFAHRRMTGSRPAINPFCIVDFEDFKHIYLTKTGFYITSGREPEKFSPLMTEYFAESILPARDLTDLGTIRMTYAQDRNLLFVSLSTSSISSMYEMAFVLHTAREEWGRWDRNHYAIGQYAFGGTGLGYYDLGFICDQGRVHKFDETFGQQTWPSNGDTVVWFDENFEHAPRVSGTTTIFSAYASGWGFDPSRYDGLPSNFYLFGEIGSIAMEPEIDPVDAAPFTDVEYIDWATASTDEDWETATGDEDWGGPYDNPTYSTSAEMAAGVIIFGTEIPDNEYAALNSWVIVGPYRIDEEEYPDVVSQVDKIVIGMPESSPAVFEDWEELEGDEDYSTSSAANEDWGGVVVSEYDYDLTLYSTNDGKYENATFTLTPTVQQVNGTNTTYDLAENRGVFNFVRLSADEANEAFHIHQLELTGFNAGRI